MFLNVLLLVGAMQNCQAAFSVSVVKSVPTTVALEALQKEVAAMAKTQELLAKNLGCLFELTKKVLAETPELFGEFLAMLPDSALHDGKYGFPSMRPEYFDLVKESLQDSKSFKENLLLFLQLTHNEQMKELARLVITQHPEKCEECLPLFIKHLWGYRQAEFSEFILKSYPKYCDLIFPIALPALVKYSPNPARNHPLYYLLKDLAGQVGGFKLKVILQKADLKEYDLDITIALADAMHENKIGFHDVPKKYQDLMIEYGLMGAQGLVAPRVDAPGWRSIDRARWWKEIGNRYIEEALQKAATDGLVGKQVGGQSPASNVFHFWEPGSDWLQQIGDLFAQRVGAQPCKMLLCKREDEVGAKAPWMALKEDNLNQSRFMLLCNIPFLYTLNLQAQPKLDGPNSTSSRIVDVNSALRSRLLNSIRCGTTHSCMLQFQHEVQQQKKEGEWNIVWPNDLVLSDCFGELRYQAELVNDVCKKPYAEGKIFLLNIVAVSRYLAFNGAEKAKLMDPKEVACKQALVNVCKTINPLLEQKGFTPFDAETLEFGINLLSSSAVDWHGLCQ